MTHEARAHRLFAVRAMRAARTAAIDDGPGHVTATGEKRQEAQDGFLGGMVEVIHRIKASG